MMSARATRPARRPSAAARLGATAGLAALALAVAAASGSFAAREAAAREPAHEPAHAARPAAPAPDGRQIFSANCASCHQASGEGVEGTYPPLAGSEWVTGGEERVVRILLHGLNGPVDVAGQTYSGAMPPWGGALSDAEIAAVTTYVRGSWGNKAAPVAPATVARVRAATAARKAPWTAAELQTATPAHE